MKVEEGQKKGLGDPILLEKIDKLFACGVSEHVNLPQLVVVGDQSSGKSSVLEGLTKLPFPRDSGLCTRFATQIIFRRSREESISVFIIPHANASPEHADRLRSWSKTDLKALDSSSFAEIMTEVNTTMGLSNQQDRSDGSKPTFSNDVLRLEITGPDEEHFSVIDVPGIFKSTTANLTTKADISLVRNMVQAYMENPRSVMLTVIPANVDVATQEILEMARDVDPDENRTLGVLTKPDLVDKGAEPRVIDLITGQARPMKLGWHLVRNPGQSQLSDPSTNREVLELDFFRTKAPWNTLEKDKVGVEALRVRLQDVLSTHVRREFPKVRSEIVKKLKAAQSQLRLLGTERESAEKQSAYLLDLATQFQKFVSQSLDAKYGSHEWFDAEPDLRLATAVMSRDELFADEVHFLGQLYEFSSSAGGGDQTEGNEEVPVGLDWSGEDVLYGPDCGDDEDMDGETEPEPCSQVGVRKTENPPELDEILYEQHHVSKCSPNGIAWWLKAVYESSRGFGLGTFDSTILATTMKRQSTKWTALALGYVSDVVAIIHTFITKLLKRLCPDGGVMVELMAVLIDDLISRYVKGLNEARFVLSVERTGRPLTLNHYFNDNLEKCRQQRTKAILAKKSFADSMYGTVVKLDDIMTNHPMSNVEHVVQDIHDILFSYYKVARKRFVDNVCMLAVDHFLVSGPETPLTLFSPAFVSRLTTEQLETIAGEEQSTKRKRRQLKKEIDSLEAGKKILL